MMNAFLKFILITAAILLTGSMAVAQIPAEVFTGHQKTTLDIMFFRYFKDKAQKNTRLLFFNRNRAVLDYKMTSALNLPQFGFIEAISYNHKKLTGLAPVLVAQLSGSGIFAKAGFQYALLNKKITVFSWLVFGINKNRNIDFFFLGRYTPRITDKINLFSQLELINVFPTIHQGEFSFVQRLRLGLKFRDFQTGLGGDFSITGLHNFITSNNIGIFLRYEY